MAGVAICALLEVPHPHREETKRVLLRLGLRDWRSAKRTPAKNACAPLGRVASGHAPRTQLHRRDRSWAALPRRLPHRWLARRRPVALVAGEKRRIQLARGPDRNRLAAGPWSVERQAD